MSFAVVGTALAVGAIAKGVGGVVKAIDGGIQKKNAKLAAEEAQLELDKRKNQFANLDTSNPYLNMENTMEDLTVNKQAAEFQKQQQMQSQANILDQMRGAAGGSGIAALAQTLANQGSIDAQKASADIASQEARNQLAERSQAAKIQGKVIEGELGSRQAEFGKVSSLMGMSANEVANARDAEAAARAQMHEGIATVGQAAGDYATGGMDASALGIDISSPFGMKTIGGVGGNKKKSK